MSAMPIKVRWEGEYQKEEVTTLYTWDQIKKTSLLFNPAFRCIGYIHVRTLLKHSYYVYKKKPLLDYFFIFFEHSADFDQPWYGTSF